MTFSEVVARLLAGPSGSEQQLARSENQNEDKPAFLCLSDEEFTEASAVKKSMGSRVDSAADRAYPVTVE